MLTWEQDSCCLWRKFIHRNVKTQWIAKDGNSDKLSVPLRCCWMSFCILSLYENLGSVALAIYSTILCGDLVTPCWKRALRGLKRSFLAASTFLWYFCIEKCSYTWRGLACYVSAWVIILSLYLENCMPAVYWILLLGSVTVLKSRSFECIPDNSNGFTHQLAAPHTCNPYPMSPPEWFTLTQ